MTVRLVPAVLVSLLLGIASGCAPADVAGNYSLAVTNGDNGCEVDGWTVGESSANVPAVITQDEGDVQVEVQGVSGTFLNLVVGSNRFAGDVAGDRVSAELIGDNSGREGECRFTWTIELDATVAGDVIEGELNWRPVTNGHPDCGMLEMCRNQQVFNGTRPPTTEE